ncbi:probable serine/threonine-protein kinase DDB_G0272282 [Cajanus cajan]|uniref:probable serine/threonine-protein kinase DDB_G0272282 n=1 Tax=Cajanus cajan TaxID=3821 RepID=UPI00098DA5DD|nr:probable serine/threonine-protein kinase DDB_G0272282 [Cajanus cajan]
MEEEFEEIEVEYAPLCEGHEIDVEYEFDAPHFFDFTRQLSLWDADEAEQWFESATSYPPSPFLLKMRRGNYSGVSPEQVSENEEDNSTGSEYGKTKHLGKSSSSKSKDFSFMKPTASHLAKQKSSSEFQTPAPSRIQRQNSSSTDGQLTKRQKVEAGYLRKVARLKHRIHFSHKKSKEAGGTDVNLASKQNVTIAKEPNLVTALRAQRPKSRTNAESGGPTQSSPQVPKARSLNKKILEGPAKIFSKMKTPPRPTECQVFHLRTSERAMQNTSNNNAGSSSNRNSNSNRETRDIKMRNSSVGSRQEKCKTNNKLRGSSNDKLSSKRERVVFRNIKVYPLDPNNKGTLNEPPSELFSKLSLASDVKQSRKSPSKEQQPISKELKENRPRSLPKENEKMKLIKERLQGACGKQYHCVNEMGSLVSKQICMLEIGH